MAKLDQNTVYTQKNVRHPRIRPFQSLVHPWSRIQMVLLQTSIKIQHVRLRFTFTNYALRKFLQYTICRKIFHSRLFAISEKENMQQKKVGF